MNRKPSVLKKRIDKASDRERIDTSDSDFLEARDKINEILKSLLLSDGKEEYDPRKTISLIEEYLQRWPRIIYSEITQFILNIKNEEVIEEGFNQNLQRLSEFVADKKNHVTPDVQKALYRLRDHAALVTLQNGNLKETIAKTFVDSKEEVKEELHKELKIELRADLHTELKK